MANVAKDYGLVPVRSLVGDIPTQTVVALSGASALFVGDPVIPAGSGDASGRMSVDIAVGSEGTESTNIYGVVVGIQAASPDSLATHAGATGSARILQVALAVPTTIFRVNASNTTGPNPNDIGLGFDLVLGSGDTNTGKSGWALDVGDDNQAGAATGQVRLVGFTNRPDNEIGAAGTDTPNVDCEVFFAESFFQAAAAGGA